MNRRDFLKSSGALIVSFSLGGEQSARAQFGGPTPGAPAMDQLDSWLAIGADGDVTAYSGKEELGQGIATAQAQLIAEELRVPFQRVKLIYCDTALTPDQAYTSGSQSHPANFNHSNLALAGATAREALFKLASQRLGIPVDQLSANEGIVASNADPQKKVSYGELIAGKRFNLTLDTNAKRVPAREWKVLGTPIPHPDLPAIVTGQFEYVHNVRLPGMLHGRVVRPPAVGGTLISVDEDSVKGMPGLVKVVVKKNFVGVVAERPWQAMQAASMLKVNWSAGSGLPAHTEFYDHMRNDKQTRDTLMVNSKDVEQKLGQAAKVLKATYRHPYQMHGSIGSSCAVADVQGDRATIYSPTQGVWYQRNTSAMILGMKPENVHVIFRRGSGCYGLNGADTVTYDAAILSQAVGRPVRVQLTRKDEMAWENYGNAFLIDQRAGVDGQGNIVAWDHESWSPSLGNRPGTGSPGNVITGFLAGFQPDPFTTRAGSPAPANFNNNSNGIPSYMAARFDGVTKGAGKVTSERVLLHAVVSPFWTGPLRSPARLQNTFAHECFMDEIAAHVKADPVELRARYLSHARLKEMVLTAAKNANWDARPSPKPGNRRTGIATGRGIACVAYEGDNGYVAMVVEAEVNQDTGAVAVKRIVVANDCGPISNPDGLRNQLEGGALQGISRTLLEEVTWDDARVTSVDWRTYRPLFLGAEVPVIETILINRLDVPADGAGEIAVTVTAAAIANAIFDATGARLRQVPFTADRVKAALAARAVPSSL